MIEGLGWLREAAFLAFLAVILSYLLPSVFLSPYRSLEQLPRPPFIDIVMIIIGLILAIASWIFEILGWSSMCRAGMRKFYCFTKYMVLLGPIMGFLFAIVGVFQTALTGKISFFLLGPLVIVAVAVIAGVASLDVGLLTNTRILTVGALLYLISVVLQAPALLQSPEFMSFGLAAGILSIPALLLMAIGFHLARRAVPHGREEAVTA
ncbi:hypothetical protein D6D85_10600 [Candidatus Methanodesulfokora washburnensis]|uniref:DUF973 family protein n=2 Tax=Candidatus Methanodesulfokora washburnensis TaxID=2478471 RepID=A0A3R9QCS5_9CREN|nr:hypothetical protein D6D85_10600 [Candidatus Methanodesulfokores washburnensis]